MGKAARQKRQRQAAAAPAPRSGSLLVVAALSLAALVGAVAFFATRGGEETPAASGDAAPAAANSGPMGVQDGEPPWVAEQEQLPARLEKIGVPFSNMEGTAFHIHPNLQVVVAGESVEVPTDIGISYAERAMAALHTHDTAGTIHVESPVVRDYTLGQFFDTWGVRLTKTCVGGYCAGSGKELKAFVDGKPVADPRAVKLVDEERIVLAYGTAAEIEKAVG
jgi:hypothetical protein